MEQLLSAEFHADAFHGPIPLTSQPLLLSALRGSDMLSSLQRSLSGLRFYLGPYNKHRDIQGKIGGTGCC